MATRIRRTPEQVIADLEAKIKAIKDKANKEPKSKAAKLTRESVGVSDAIMAIEVVATENNVSVGDVIKAIARIKRTGLKIENGVKKAKAE